MSQFVQISSQSLCGHIQLLGLQHTHSPATCTHKYAGVQLYKTNVFFSHRQQHFVTINVDVVCQGESKDGN